MKKWNGRESDYEKAERKESEMGIYEERLQEVSIYGERSSEISSGRSCHLRSSRLSVLSEPAGTAVYGNPFGICAMTVCMGIYGLSYWLGVKIVDIEV